MLLVVIMSLYLDTQRSKSQHSWTLLVPTCPILPSVLELPEGVVADAEPHTRGVPDDHVLPRLLPGVVPYVGIRFVSLRKRKCLTLIAQQTLPRTLSLLCSADANNLHLHVISFIVHITT